jgi:mannose/fructose-specific phosphotransferase system component IIA
VFGHFEVRPRGCVVAGRLDKSLIETVPTKVAGEEETVTFADWAAATPQAAANTLAENDGRV